MEWLNNRLGQIIAGVTVAGTLAGFGYEGAQTINRIDNLESNVAGFISATDIALSNTIEQLDSIENRVIIIEQQLESLDVPDIGAIEKDIVALKAHAHPAQAMPDLSGIKEDIAVLKTTVESLKNKDANPLAN